MQYIRLDGSMGKRKYGRMLEGAPRNVESSDFGPRFRWRQTDILHLSPCPRSSLCIFGLLGFRFARIALAPAQPHCARPRILEYSDSLSWAGATSQAYTVRCNTKCNCLGFAARPGLRPSGAFY